MGRRHGGMNAKTASLIAASCDDAPAGGIAADNDRVTAQFWLVALAPRAAKNASISTWVILRSSAMDSLLTAQISSGTGPGEGGDALGI